MKILFSLTYYTPYISGLTLYVKRLGEVLAKSKYNISVITMQHDSSLSLEETINGVRVVRAKPLFRVSKGFISLDWLVKSWQGVRKTDVVVLNLPQFEAIFPALFAKIFKKKVIAIYHCEICLPDGVFNRLWQLLLESANRISLYLADQVITYTQDYARHSRLLKPFLKKVGTVYPPVPVPKIDKRTLVSLQRQIKRDKEEILVGFAGRIAAEKGIEYLLEAVQKLNIYRYDARSRKRSVKLLNKKIKLVIAGPRDEVVGEEKYVGKIGRRVEELGNQVVFLGLIEPDKMGAFYKLIDILVLPSVNSTEAFGMVQVEAMMMGVPVIASDLPGVRVPIKETGMGIVVPPRNAKRIFDAILTITEDRKRYIKSREEIMRIFSFVKTIEFYKKEFEGVK